jgi:hypothetical protein
VSGSAHARMRWSDLRRIRRGTVADHTQEWYPGSSAVALTGR